MIDLQRLKHNLDEFDVIVCFSGLFSQGIIEELSDAIRNYFCQDNVPRGQSTNVISVFVEQAQNIINYSQENSDYVYKDLLAESGIVTVGKLPEGYFVSSGNLVEKGDLEKLIEKIEYINSLNTDELKKYYKAVMRTSSPDKSNSAGLGLITMARKSKNKIEYDRTHYNDMFSYFSISIAL